MANRARNRVQTNMRVSAIGKARFLSFEEFTAVLAMASSRRSPLSSETSKKQDVSLDYEAVV